MSATTENYLKTIFAASEQSGNRLVSLGEIAVALSVTPGTVTTMMKSLQKDGLVEYTPRTGVRLTNEGRAAALTVLRRHRLLELFLVEVLGLDWSLVHDEAEVLEHAISDQLLERIDELLDHPTADPHGDPIPRGDGTVATVTSPPLADIAAGNEVTVTRVEHGDAGFMGFLQEAGLTPGSQVTVSARNEISGTLEVHTEFGSHTLSLGVAGRIRVDR